MPDVILYPNVSASDIYLYRTNAFNFANIILTPNIAADTSNTDIILTRKSDFILLPLIPLVVLAEDDITLDDVLITFTINPLYFDVFDSITLDEFVSVNESILSYLSINIFDSISLDDTNTNIIINPLNPSVFDISTLTESLTVYLLLSMSVFDSITLNDFTQVTINPLYFNVFDSITLDEQSQITINPLYFNVFDNITLNEIVIVTVGMVSPLSINVFDIVSLDEIAIGYMLLSMSVFDSVVISESQTATINPLYFNVFDSITLDDTFADIFINPVIVSVTDDIILDDNTTIVIHTSAIILYVTPIVLSNGVGSNILLGANIPIQTLYGTLSNIEILTGKSSITFSGTKNNPESFVGGH